MLTANSPTYRCAAQSDVAPDRPNYHLGRHGRDYLNGEEKEHVAQRARAASVSMWPDTSVMGYRDKLNLPASVAQPLSTAPKLSFPGPLCGRPFPQRRANSRQLFVDGTATTPLRRT